MRTARTLSLISVCAVFAASCAFNRGQVKSLQDQTANRIQFDAVIDTTISALNTIPSHCGPAGNRRVRDEEFHVYRVAGTISRVKRERDHDIHIVLVDTAHRGERLVVELDDPDFGKNAASPFHDKLTAARRTFDALVAESSVSRLSDLQGTHVRVTGVGFFDLNHFQVGRSRSCIELHPMLMIEKGGSSATSSW
jgi:hypothetical protein